MPSFPPLTPETAAYTVPPAYIGEAPRPRSPRTITTPSAGESSLRTVPPSKKAVRQPLQGKVVLTDKDRRYSPLIHRIAGVAMIVIGVIIGAILAAIPLLGPALFIGCLALGIMGNIRSRKIAAALEQELPVSGFIPK